MALALRTAVRSIKTPNTALCRRWNTSDVFSNSKNVFNSQSKHSGSKWVTHEGAQVLKNPVLKPVKVQSHRLFDPDDCIFPKHLHTWQKFVCGGVGLTGGVIGVCVGITITSGVVIVVSNGLKYGIDSCCNWFAEQKAVSSSSDDVNEDSHWDTITKGLFNAVDNVFDNISNGLSVAYDAIPELVVDSIKFAGATTAVPVFIGSLVGIFDVFIDETKVFFKEIKSMENCCNIIRFGAAGTASTAMMGFIGAGGVGVVLYIGMYSIGIGIDIIHKWQHNSGNRHTPYRPEDDEYDQIYDITGPILD